MMLPDRVMVWKFETAPPELRALHTSGTSPRWVALIPAAIHGRDLQETIEARSGIEKFDMESGDVVYIGLAEMTEFLELVGTLLESPTAPFGSRPADA